MMAMVEIDYTAISTYLELDLHCFDDDDRGFTVRRRAKKNEQSRWWFDDFEQWATERAHRCDEHRSATRDPLSLEPRRKKQKRDPKQECTEK
jgi:hypothetical protein